MCLSTAYLNKKEDELVAARYVAAVRIDGESVILTDVIGSETVVEGSLEYIDLTEGYVIIRTEAA